MKFSCTKNSSLITNLEGALLNPIPIEDSLWIPNRIHELPNDFFQNIHTKTFNEIAYIVAKELIGAEIPEDTLKNIIEESFNFCIPLESVDNDFHILELFHGPTFTFKDVGARFMSRIIKYFIGDKKIDILVATSGDTGSAVADAFYEMPNVTVHILYPKGKISSVQELQITGYGKNIIAYELNGDFDDCQNMVKKTLADRGLKRILDFFPANSISIARLIPQTFYYFWMYAQLKKKHRVVKNVYVSIPSGNLGNLTGGIVSFKMGLPIKMFIAATNDNKAFGEYLYNNVVFQKKAIHTISNAMDVCIPNNLERLKAIFHDYKHMQNKIASISVSRENTLQTIDDFYKSFQYTVDPHTAVGVYALKKYLRDNEITHYTAVVIATAHPAKFPEIMKITNAPYSIPERIAIMKNIGNKTSINNNYDIWKNILIRSKGFKNITLIGMPGSGKSYIGKMLSKKLKWNHVDIDKKIENTYNKKLEKLIAEKGSDEFKKIEEYTTLSVYGVNNVFSPGGSVIYSKKAIEYLKSISLVVYLNTPLDIITQRVKSPRGRGVIMSDRMSMVDLYTERYQLYNRYCHLEIDCSLYKDSKICDCIIKYI